MKRLPTTVTAFVLTLLSAGSACGDAPTADPQTARQINQANQKVRDGQYEQAIEDLAAVDSPADRSVVNYNLAVAQFRAGNLDAAETLFAEAAGAADASIAAKSRYNLGNCQYAKAIQEAEKDKARAVELLREAIDHYRASLQGDPNNVDARANIELAMRLIRQLKQEQQQQDQTQQQDQQPQNQEQENQEDQSQQNQDQQDQGQQQDSQQQNQDQQNQENSEQNSEQQQSDSQQQQQENSQQQDQPNDSEQKDSDEHQSPQDSQQQDSQQQDQADQQQQKQQAPQDAQPQEQSSQQDNKQTQNTRPQRQKPQQDDPNSEGQNEDEQHDDETQEVPTGDLRAAQEQQDDQQERGITIGDPGKEEGLISKEEALKLLQAVRDRDMLRRLRRQQQERSRHQPVERDW